MTLEEHGEGNGASVTPSPEVQAAVKAVTRTRWTEIALVIAAAIVLVWFGATTAWNTYKVRTLTQTNVKAQDFGLHAINCILDNLADHRWSNQVFHDNLAQFFHAPTTPHVPLPVVPSDAQFARDCAPFNLRVEQREGTQGPTVTSMPTTTTTMEVPNASTTGR